MSTGHVVIMAKPAVQGLVKTRLIGELSPLQAAEVHLAMWRAVVERVTQAFAEEGVELVVALASIEQPEQTQTGKTLVDLPSGWRTIDQGQGNLGDRLDHVWRALGRGRILFLGVDSPDVPLDALHSAWAGSSGGDEVAIGPVDDGGYWTLASGSYRPALVQGIDWGSAKVYDQTWQTAVRSGLKARRLLSWHDVDDHADLQALRGRLTDTREASLVALRNALNRICKDAKNE